MGAWEDGFAAGYRTCMKEHAPISLEMGLSKRPRIPRGTAKPKRRASAYSKRYGAAFKRLAKKNKKKGGGWKKGGFARTQKAAHRAAKK